MIHDLNDSKPQRWLIWLNALSAVASAVFGIVALLAPAANPGVDNAGMTSAATFYAAMYGVRAVLLAVAVVWLAARCTLLVPLLLLAGTVQVGDVVIGISAGQAGMALGATIGMVIHLGSAWLLVRRPRLATTTAG